LAGLFLRAIDWAWIEELSATPPRFRRAVYIREDKGSKIAWSRSASPRSTGCSGYVDEVRPRHAVEPDPGTVFLTTRGKPPRENRRTELQAGLGKTGSCHLFRHTTATLMLENGADVRYVQALLGHAQLSTTELYTRVSIAQLKAVHQRTHPAHRTRAAQLSSLAAEAAERA
jgi:integrase/recombinase XerD